MKPCTHLSLSDWLRFSSLQLVLMNMYLIFRSSPRYVWFHSKCPGGPVIEMKYGRKDAESPDDCVDEGYLPAGNAPFPDAETPQDHLRNVFYRMGFGDEGIVALSGAHTLGRAFKVCNAR